MWLFSFVASFLGLDMEIISASRNKLAGVPSTRIFWERLWRMDIISFLLYSVMSNSSCQAFLPMGFPRQEYWSGVPFPTPGVFSAQGLHPRSCISQARILEWGGISYSRGDCTRAPASPALRDSLRLVPPGKPRFLLKCLEI